MLVCEKCQKEHDGSYASGRFCSASCSRSYSSMVKREEINKKVSEKIRQIVNTPGYIKPMSRPGAKEKWKATRTKNLEAQGKLKSKVAKIDKKQQNIVVTKKSLEKSKLKNIQ